jgi:hypothetical protein
VSPRLRLGGALVALLPDESYAPEMVRVVHAAKARVLVSVFIVDPRTAAEPFTDLVDALAQASWRGLDAIPIT